MMKSSFKIPPESFPYKVPVMHNEPGIGHRHDTQSHGHIQDTLRRVRTRQDEDLFDPSLTDDPQGLSDLDGRPAVVDPEHGELQEGGVEGLGHGVHNLN